MHSVAHLSKVLVKTFSLHEQSSVYNEVYDASSLVSAPEMPSMPLHYWKSRTAGTVTACNLLWTSYEHMDTENKFSRLDSYQCKGGEHCIIAGLYIQQSYAISVTNIHIWITHTDNNRQTHTDSDFWRFFYRRTSPKSIQIRLWPQEQPFMIAMAYSYKHPSVLWCYFSGQQEGHLAFKKTSY